MTKNWYPVINYGKCIGCLACVSFCPTKVYSEVGGRPAVVNSNACPDGCRGCESICKADAITHKRENPVLSKHASKNEKRSKK